MQDDNILNVAYLKGKKMERKDLKSMGDCTKMAADLRYPA